MEKSKDSRRTNKNQMIAGMYDLGETLGEGHYAVVKLAKHVFTGEMVAVKVIDKMKLDAATRLQMLQEVRLMKLVQHPYVVRLYEVIDTQTKLYLVLEFADGGDMYDYIMKHEGGLEEKLARKYFRQIVTAIQYCHKLHVVHRDLKPENVVFFEKLGMVKLTDFGFSNKFSPGQRLQTSCGSLAYSAPEILLGDAYDAPAVDIWSLGVILYMLVCGAAPFQEANDSETLTMIMDCKYTFPTHISVGCKSLISRMLQRQPEVRASLEDIIRDPWLNESSHGTAELPTTECGNPAWLEDMIPEEVMLPLAAREHLSEEDHSTILQRMVNGSIAHKEDIIEALDRNEYNHITATYFLLAERRLRAQRQLDATKKRSSLHDANVMTVSETTGSGSPEVDTEDVTSSPPMRGRTGSIPTSPIKERLDANSSAIVQSVVDSLTVTPTTTRRVKRRSQTAIVDSLLSPQESPTRSLSTSGPSPGIVSSLGPPLSAPHRLRKCSIVEEEEDEPDERPFRIARSSRHSSTSSLADKSSSIVTSTAAATTSLAEAAAVSLNLRLTSATSGSTEKVEAPAPFPLTSQIGTGGLSRQGSLRGANNTLSGKSGGETPNGSSSPTSERKSMPESPTTPTTAGSSATSSTHGSPARLFKISLPGGNRKLAATRSSPQLVPSTSVLNQIHEEAEEGASPASSLTCKEATASVDPVDQFPNTPAGAVVIKRLEARRRLRLLKSRTTSCSSSDGSDDDSESRRQRREQELAGHTPSPPPRPIRRERQQTDDSSDSQEPGGGGGGTGLNSNIQTSSDCGHCGEQGSAADSGQTNTSGGSSRNSGSHREQRSTTMATASQGRHRHHVRVRQSHSLNRISELHAEDFLLGCESMNMDEDTSTTTTILSNLEPKAMTASNRNSGLQRQLSSESDSDGTSHHCDMLSRYLDSLSSANNNNRVRSRDDSLNSSDGEFDAGMSASDQQQQPRPPRRHHHKVNLLSLEQRLNKIQEECQRSGSDADEDEDAGDDGDISDNVSTSAMQENAGEDGGVGSGEGGDEGGGEDVILDLQPQQQQLTMQRLRISKRSFNNYNSGSNIGDHDETTSVKSCDVAPLRNNKERKHALHRAHSCGSLFSLKERALLRRKLSNAHFGVAATTFWDLIKTTEEVAKTGNGGTKSAIQNELTLALTAAATSPLTVFNIQGTSRCCNLC